MTIADIARAFTFIAHAVTSGARAVRRVGVIRVGLVGLSVLLVAPTLVSVASQSAVAPPQTRGHVPVGQSATRLTDGRWLVLGGQGVEGTAVVWDAPSGTATPTFGAAPLRRAFQSATVLADGRVLIAGGRQAGAIVETLEIFDPATGGFVPIAIGGAEARAGHSCRRRRARARR